MTDAFVVFTNSMTNPLMAYSSGISYLKSMGIDKEIEARMIYCRRRSSEESLHTNITEYTVPYVFGRTVDDIVELPSILRLFNNYDMRVRNLTYGINIPEFREGLIKRLEEEALILSSKKTVFFSVFRYHFLYHLILSAMIKQINHKVKIVFGGPQIINSELTVEVLNSCPFIDHIIQGDIETGLYCYYTDALPRVFITPRLPLKYLTEPDYTKEPLFIFKGQIMMTTSRNCYNKCAYCPSVYMPYDEVPLKNVEEWVKNACANVQVRSIYFTDAMFNGSIKRFDGVLDILLKYQNGQTFYIWCHSNYLTKGHIDKLSELNLSEPGMIVLAYDSASKEMNKLINREANPDIDELIDYCIQKGLNLYTPFIEGLPVETNKDFNQLYWKIKELREKHGRKITIAIHSFLFIPGSPFYEKYEDYGIRLEYWDDETALIYYPLYDVVKRIPRYYYGNVTPEVINNRIEKLNEFR